MAAQTEISVGLIGLGYWGPNLLRVLTEAEGVRIAYLCDRDEDRARRYARRSPEAAVTTDADAVLADPGVDAVLIATPVSTHHRLAKSSLEAGKHTFVEKPLAASGAEALELEELSKRMDLTLMCGHTFLYSPPVLAVRDLLQRGELGDLCFISSSRVNLGIHQRDLSIIWDLGPHDFSILLSWLGSPPDSVRAIGRDSIVKGIHDVAFVDLAFPGGVLAHVEMSWLAPSKLRRTVIVGRERMVVYDDGSAEQLRIFDHGVVFEDPETFGEYQLSYRTGDIVSPKLEVVEPLVAEMEDFLAAVRERRPMPENVALARNVIAMMESSDLSIERGGDAVPFSPPALVP